METSNKDMQNIDLAFSIAIKQVYCDRVEKEVDGVVQRLSMTKPKKSTKRHW